MTSLNAISESTAGFSVLPENIIQNLESPEVQHAVLSSFEELVGQLNAEGKLPVRPNTREVLDYISARKRLNGQLELSQDAITRETQRNIANFRGRVDIALEEEAMQA